MNTIKLILGLFLLAIVLTMIFVICRAASLSEQAQEKALSEQTKNKTNNAKDLMKLSTITSVLLTIVVLAMTSASILADDPPTPGPDTNSIPNATFDHSSMQISGPSVNGSPMAECVFGPQGAGVSLGSPAPMWNAFGDTNYIQDAFGLTIDLSPIPYFLRLSKTVLGINYAADPILTSRPSQTALVHFEYPRGISAFNLGSGIDKAACVIFNNYWRDMISTNPYVFSDAPSRSQVITYLPLRPGDYAEDYLVTFDFNTIYPHECTAITYSLFGSHEDLVDYALEQAGACAGKNGFFKLGNVAQQVAPKARPTRFPTANAVFEDQNIALSIGNSADVGEVKGQYLASVNWGDPITTTNAVNTNLYAYVWVGGMGSNKVSTLQFKNDLNATNWSTFGTETNDRFGNGVFIVPLTNTMRYFRTCTATN